MSELFAFEIGADAYRMQRRPNHGQVVVNDGVRGAYLLDPHTGAVGTQIEFPIASVIDAWAFRADGDLMVAFSDEEFSACVSDLTSGNSRVVAHPPWTSTVGMPYDWRGEELWMKDPESFAFASFDAALGTMREDDGLRALHSARAWRRATDRMRRLDAVCRCVEPEMGRALISSFDGTDSRVGFVSWIDEAEPLVSVPGRPARLGAVGDLFAALYEHECLLVDHRGNHVGRIPAPAGFRLVAVATFPATGSSPAVLILAAAVLDAREGARTRISTHSL